MLKHLMNAMREWRKDRLLKKIAKQTSQRRKVKDKALSYQAKYEQLLRKEVKQ